MGCVDRVSVYRVGWYGVLFGYMSIECNRMSVDRMCRVAIASGILITHHPSHPNLSISHLVCAPNLVLVYGVLLDERGRRHCLRATSR